MSGRSVAEEGPLRRWTVAGAVLEGADGVLMVENRRMNGRVDWTPPGGVIESATGEDLLDGLTREVSEETGLRVTVWDRLLYRVEAIAPDLGWHMTAHIWRAAAWVGDVSVGDDPDGIVTNADWLSGDALDQRLDLAPQWVHEPLRAWLGERWVGGSTTYRYRVEGLATGRAVISRLTAGTDGDRP